MRMRWRGKRKVLYARRGGFVSVSKVRYVLINNNNSANFNLLPLLM